MTEIVWTSPDVSRIQTGFPILLPPPEGSFSNVIDPTNTDFGAMGDGVTDDSAALNAMFDHIRAISNISEGSDVAQDRYVQYVATGGGRSYVVKTSLNATGIRNGLVALRDFTFIWEGDAVSTVLDLCHSVHTSWTNCHVWSTDAYPTRIGIQQCRNSSGVGQVSGEHTFLNCTVKGYFSVAAWMNYASEVCAYLKCEAWNFADGPNTYAFVLQNDDLIPCTSLYQTVDTVVQPFNAPAFVNCEFRRRSNATNPTAAALFIAGTSGLSMTGNCYAVSYGDRAVVLSGDTNHSRIQLHIEGDYDYAWYQVQGAASVTHVSFEWYDHNNHSHIALFGTDSTGGISNFNDSRIQIGGLGYAPAVFSDPSKYSLKGMRLTTPGTAYMPTIPGTFALFSGEATTADRIPTTIRYERTVNGTSTGDNTSGAATANGIAGRITTHSLTTAAGASTAITVGNTYCIASDPIQVTLSGGGNTTPIILKAVTGADLWTLTITNIGSVAMNGTVVVSYQLTKRAT